MIKRTIPSTNEELAVIGLGTWRVFDVADKQHDEKLKEVLSLLHESGGRLIDSSPMYGNAEETIGRLTQELPFQNEFFYATKVWTEGESEGIRQMEHSMSKMKRGQIDLMQIHNLVDWRTHLKTLRSWKASGKVKYIGITHYTDAMHEVLMQVIQQEPLDFVQFNYSVTNRNAEKRLLPLCADKGVAVLINRPFGTGQLFASVKNRPLPEFAKEMGMDSWSELLLKYILAHPAVTCVIPATGDPAHMADNLKAGIGALPDEGTCKAIRNVFE
jgi:diketogulonate reductase-like aldo/keto reductase